MRTLQYHEAKQRGSMEFPLDYHYIDRNHVRYEMPYHWHEETEILFVLSGTFSLSLDGESMEFHPGEAAYFPAGSLHAGTPHDCVYECIVFDLRMLLSAPGLCREKMGEIEGRKVRLQRRYGSDDPLVRETLRPLFEGIRAVGLEGAGATLTVALYVYAKEQGEFGVAFAIAAILMFLTLVINLAAGLVTKYYNRKKKL